MLGLTILEVYSFFDISKETNHNKIYIHQKDLVSWREKFIFDDIQQNNVFWGEDVRSETLSPIVFIS